MWPFDSEEEVSPDVSEFSDVADEISNMSQTQDAGLSGLQDLYNSYGFEDSPQARDSFVAASDKVRKKFGDTQAYDYNTALDLAPVDMSQIVVESQDPEEAKLERINKWEEENLKNLDETTDLGYLQGRSQLSRGIQQAATQQRRDYYGADNYIATDLALRFGQGVVGPIADLVGADSVSDYFTEHTDPSRDDSYWSAIASGAGSAAGAIGAGVLTEGWGTAAYLGASGAGSVVKQVRDSIDNEGSYGEAAAAGGIEAVNQAVQAGVGAKVFGGAVKGILGEAGSSLGARIFPRIAKDALLEGGTEALGQVVSNEAENIGQDKQGDILAGVAQSGVAGLIVGGAAAGIGEHFGKSNPSESANQNSSTESNGAGGPPEAGAAGALLQTGDYQETKQGNLADVAAPDPINELQNTIQELEGSPPPAAESIPAGRLSVELENPSREVMKLSDGSSIVQSDGNLHLMKDGNVLQTYEQLKYIKPEIAQKLRQRTDNKSGGPDGTAITLTTDKKGNLFAESDFITKDLNISATKTGASRVAIPTEENAQGNVPVFVNETKTTNDVRQNGSMIAPGTVESTAGSALAGSIGEQKVNEFHQGLIDKYGPDVSSDLGFSTESFEQNKDGSITSKQVPLVHYFTRPQTPESADPARAFITEKGPFAAMAYLNNKDAFTAQDQDVANILHHDIETAFFANAKNGNIPEAARLSGLLTDISNINAKGGNEGATALGRRTKKARARVLGTTVGDIELSRINTELSQQAYDDYKKQTGEDLNLGALNEESKVAEQEMKANAPVETKGEDGKVTKEPLSPESQKKYDEAKAKFDKATEKINIADTALKDRLSKLTPEDAKSLADLHNVLDATEEPTMKAAVAGRIFDMESKLLTKDSSPAFFDRLHSFYLKNLLSGVGTQERNALGNSSVAISNIVGLVGRGELNMAGLYANEWLKGTPAALREAGQILAGKREGRFKYGENVKDKDGQVKNVNNIPSINPLEHPFTFIQNAMYRALNASDMIFYRNAESSMAYLAEHVANQNIKDPVERKAAIETALGRTPKQREEIEKAVNAHADLLKTVGIELSPAQIKEAKYERMQQLRSDSTRKIANEHGERSILTNDPKGVMGVAYDGFDWLSKRVSVEIGGTKVQPLKYAIPFTRVASNIASHIMEFTPVGAIKGFSGLDIKIPGTEKTLSIPGVNNPNAEPGLFNHALNPIDAKMVMGRSIVGSMLMGAMFSIAHAYKDDEKPFIEFYGYPPPGKWQEWKNKGIDAFSVRVGDSVYPLQQTSLAILPAIVGGSMQAIKSGADVTDVIKAASVASLGAVSTMSFLQSAGNLYDYITGSKDQVNNTPGEEKGSSAKKASNAFYNQVDSIGSGFIPASGFLNNIGRWMNSSPVETYNNLSAKLLGDLPFAGAVEELITGKETTIQKPQLNRFGEPITTTLTQRFSAGLAPHTIKTDPVNLWMQETGYDFPDQGPILRLTTKDDKRYSDSQKDATGYSDILNEDQSRAVLEISGPQIKAYLENVMKQPNFQVKSKAGQQTIDDNVNKFRAKAKAQVLHDTAYGK